jgi:hypothetical protein
MKRHHSLRSLDIGKGMVKESLHVGFFRVFFREIFVLIFHSLGAGKKERLMVVVG